jgi:hypothetical protein
MCLVSQGLALHSRKSRRVLSQVEPFAVLDLPRIACEHDEMSRSAANLPDDPRWSSDWAEARNFMTSMGPDFAHEVDVIESIVVSGLADQMVFKHSMHDLWIAAAPIRSGPTEYIHIHAPNSMPASRAGHVLIEHRSFGGRDDRIERPRTESVPLFWRFVKEKFGLTAVGAESND